MSMLPRADNARAYCERSRMSIAYRLRRLAARAVLVLALMLPILLLTDLPGSGDDQGVQAQRSFSIIRDSEIEQTLRYMSTPIFRAAAFDPDRINIIIVNDHRLNAFVAGGMNMFLHTGLIMAAENPEELLGVIAHETGHIAGGHLVRGSEAIARSGITAAASTILGIIAAAAAGDPEAGIAIIQGGQEIARRSFLANSRSIENQADQAGLSFLEEAGISSAGLLSFFMKLQSQELLPASQQDEYIRTHPLTQDRITAVRAHVESSAFTDTRLPDDFYDRFDRIRAKLIGYLRPPRETLRRFSADDEAILSRYARAVAFFRAGIIDESLRLFDELIAAEPDNPFFLEMKGQVLFENGRIAESVPYYRRAIAMMPNAGLMRIALSHALIESNNPEFLPEAIGHLNKALENEDTTPMLHRWLGIAYGRLGNQPMADLHLAEEALLQGRRQDAERKARIAMAGLEEGSPPWFQAQDILSLLRSL